MLPKNNSNHHLTREVSSQSIDRKYLDKVSDKIDNDISRLLKKLSEKRAVIKEKDETISRLEAKCLNNTELQSRQTEYASFEKKIEDLNIIYAETVKKLHNKKVEYDLQKNQITALLEKVSEQAKQLITQQQEPSSAASTSSAVNNVLSVDSHIVTRNESKSKC